MAYGLIGLTNDKLEDAVSLPAGIVVRPANPNLFESPFLIAPTIDELIVSPGL